MKYTTKMKGFTLIEVLVVLFIISIVTAIALLTIGNNEQREVKQFAEELTQILTLAEEQAMLQPTVLGLALNQDSFHFASYQLEADKKKNYWKPLHDNLLGKHRIPSDIEVNIKMGKESGLPNHEPQIIISTNGDLTPFTIYVGKQGEKPLYEIKGDADGHVTNTLLS